MESVKHTPGPWRITEEFFPTEHGSVEIYDEGSKWLATALGTHVGPATKEEAKANAKLIVVAPDMLTELKDNHEFLLQIYGALNNRNGLDFNSIQQSLRDRMAKQLTIINKATV